MVGKPNRMSHRAMTRQTSPIRRSIGFGRFGLAVWAFAAWGHVVSGSAVAQQPWAAGVASSSPSTPPVTDVVLNSNAFHIPFNIAPTGAPPKEVQLFVAEIAPSGASSPTASTSHRLASSAAGEPAAGKPWPAAGQTLGGWRLLDRQAPDAGQFYVEGVPDGAFWFAIRTLDGSGRPANEELIRPELRVIVDTARPEVQVDADADAEGMVRASFTVHDATATKQITAHYVTDSTRKWQVARVESTAGGGKIEIAPADDWQQLSLRIRVVDQAGNESIVSELIKKPRVAAGSTRFASGPALPPGNFFQNLIPGNNAAGSNTAGPNTAGPNTAGPYAGGPYAAGTNPAASPNPEMVPLPPPATPEEISNDFGLSSPANPKVNQNAARDTALRSSSNEATATPSPGNNTVAGQASKRPQTPAEAMRPIDTSEFGGGRVPSDAPGRSDDSGSGDEFVRLNAPAPALRPGGAGTGPKELRDSRPGSGTPASPQPETGFYSESIPAPSGRPEQTDPANRAIPSAPGANSNLPLDGPRQSPRQTEMAESTGVPWESTEPTTRRRQPVTDSPVNQADLLTRLARLAPVRFSDSLRFSLDYEIEAIGGRGVQDVELYGTTDGGETWTRWGQDPDRQTPFDIETLREGVFGFRIVVVATNGLASPRPLPGDAPDIVVVVDESEPEAVITGARYGEGDRTGSLVIQYRCDDANLLPRPVTLAFGESIDGPWTTIAAGLRNVGDYVWPADPQLPRQIFLRLDVTDEAGNVGTYVLDQPIDTQGLAPRARIRAFRPISARGGLRGSFVPKED